MLFCLKNTLLLHSTYINTVPCICSFNKEQIKERCEWKMCLSQQGFHSSLSFCRYQVEAVVKDGLAVPDGLAVDWVAKNLYFVDSSAKRIFVCKLNGSHLSSLITKDLSNPRGIAVDPRDG